MLPMTRMKCPSLAITALCAMLGSGCLSVVTYDNYWQQQDVRTKLAAEALAAEVAVGLVGGLAYSLEPDVSLGDGVATGVGAALLIDLQAAVILTIAGLIRHGGAR